MTQKIELDRLRDILDYTPETGVFTWKVKVSDKINIGQRAGSNAAKGYRQLKVAGVVYNEHRLAWFYVYGSWPEKDIDHINQIKNDNRIENLRDVPKSINSLNKYNPNTNSTIGYRGVRWDKNKYTATVRYKGVSYPLGRFNDAEEASKAYQTTRINIINGEIQ